MSRALPWWEMRPGLLNAELAALERAGMPGTLREKVRHEDQVIAVDFQASFGDRALRLVGIYPDLYPFFPPVVIAEDEAFRQHQHPFMKHLCLLGDTSQWHMWDTLADLVTAQMPELLRHNGEAV